MKTIDTLRAALAASAVFTWTLPASAGGEYIFTNIADTNGQFSGFGLVFQAPILNDNGVAAFFAELDGGDNSGVFTGNGGPITTIADESGQFSGFTAFETTINNSGLVAFRAHSDSGGHGIFTSDGGPATTIAHTDGPFNNFFASQINDAGAVVFHAFNDSFHTGIYAGSGGAVTTIAEAPEDFAGVSAPSINDSGVVVFLAYVGRGGFWYDDYYLIKAEGETFTTVIDHTSEFSGFSTPMINNAGVLAVSAVIDDDTPDVPFDNPHSIIKIDGGTVTTIADETGDFSSVFNPDINDRNDIVFRAELAAGGVGLFTGPDAENDKVIQTGDELFGSTVTALAFFRGLNNSGQVAYRYELANGVVGIAIATPDPDPVPGDATGDGIVNVNDLLAVINGWGACPAPPATCDADIAPAPNGDGTVNVNDLLMVINNWG